MITLTTEQAQQIEEALMKIADLRNLGKIQPEVIAFETLYIIRAARAQEQAEQEPVQIGWQCAECKAPVRDGYTCDVCDSGLAEERYAAPQPVKQEPVLKVGNLVTINQDPYPALGKLFVQLWDGDDLIARVYANDEETLNKRVSVLNAAPVQQAEQEPEYKGWYCAHCERGVDGSEVTFHEQHEVCGRVITNDVPPKPVMQEPVAWAHPSGGYLSARYMKEFATGLEKETYTIPLYAAPVQQVEQEPVAEILVNDKDVIVLWHKTARQLGHQAKLYTHPVRTKDLTDDEIAQAVGSPLDEVYLADFRAVIAADRELNR